jgi:hypothetical protein
MFKVRLAQSGVAVKLEISGTWFWLLTRLEAKQKRQQRAKIFFMELLLTSDAANIYKVAFLFAPKHKRHA